MTKPTTAECTEWLDKEIQAWANTQASYERDGEYDQAARCANNAAPLKHIRAQLLAAQEMAKALAHCIGHLKGLPEYMVDKPEELKDANEPAIDYATRRLTAWRAAGGEQ